MFHSPPLTTVNVTQQTNSSYQETGPQVWNDKILYTNFGGSQDIDIWQKDVDGVAQPLIEAPGQQWLTSFYKNKVTYSSYDETASKYDVHVYDISKNVDTKITNSIDSYDNGVTNGKEVAYLKGGPCGTLYLYNIKKATTKQVADNVCTPKISEDWLIYNGNGTSGPGIYGYNLKNQKYKVIYAGQGPVDTINISDETVIWMKPEGNRYQIMTKDLDSNKQRTLLDTTEYNANNPSISKKYAVWGKSSTPGQAGVEGVDLKTGKLFEVFTEGPHQNTNLETAIEGDTVVWKAWRTGNGDIYSARISK